VKQKECPLAKSTSPIVVHDQELLVDFGRLGQ